MLPWGSHYGDVVTRANHAWVVAELERDPAVKAAIIHAKEASRAIESNGDKLRFYIPKTTKMTSFFKCTI